MTVVWISALSGFVGCIIGGSAAHLAMHLVRFDRARRQYPRSRWPLRRLWRITR